MIAAASYYSSQLSTSMNEVKSNYAVIMLFTMQACWVAVGFTVCRTMRQSWCLHVKIFGKQISLYSVFFAEELWDSWCNFKHDWRSPLFSFCANSIQSQINQTTCHGALQINVVWLTVNVWVGVHMLNSHSADWQAVPALLIQICSAEAVQKVSQLPDWKD